MIHRPSKRSLIFGASLFSLLGFSLLPIACSGDDADQPQEPVAPATEQTPYPEDPDMAKTDTATGDKPADEAPDGVGELTKDPFDGQKPVDDAATGSPSDPSLPTRGIL